MSAGQQNATVPIRAAVPPSATPWVTVRSLRYTADGWRIEGRAQRFEAGSVLSTVAPSIIAGISFLALLPLASLHSSWGALGGSTFSQRNSASRANILAALSSGIAVVGHSPSRMAMNWGSLRS